MYTLMYVYIHIHIHELWPWLRFIMMELQQPHTFNEEWPPTDWRVVTDGYGHGYVSDRNSRFLGPHKTRGEWQKWWGWWDGAGFWGGGGHGYWWWFETANVLIGIDKKFGCIDVVDKEWEWWDGSDRWRTSNYTKYCDSEYSSSSD